MGFSIVMPPIQRDFTEQDVESLIVSRRRLCTEWTDVLRKPVEAGKDWCLTLPFENSYANAFEAMCDTEVFSHVAASGKLCLYLRDIDFESGPPQEVHDWIATVGKYVAMKDHLALSFALDYDREGGDPNKPQTKIGLLRSAAKPYGDTTATASLHADADRLVEPMLAFLHEMSCYKSADCVVAMPPSDPTKTYNLPRVLAEGIASRWGRADLTASVATTSVRRGLKNKSKAEKLATLRGTISVDEKAFQGKHVLLVDDLYQSGISLNYCALLLRQAGAKKVFGLACEKTCRNDDNLAGK